MRIIVRAVLFATVLIVTSGLVSPIGRLSAQVRVNTLADQIEFSKKALSAAEQSLKLARQRQQFGVGEVLENIQAEQDLTRARLDYLTAITGNNRAQFALRRAVGRK